jgi:hypothetical protein
MLKDEKTKENNSKTMEKQELKSLHLSEIESGRG